MRIARVALVKLKASSEPKSDASRKDSKPFGRRSELSPGGTAPNR
jgi:hypothetical protein